MTEAIVGLHCPTGPRTLNLERLEIEVQPSVGRGHVAKESGLGPSR